MFNPKGYDETLTILRKADMAGYKFHNKQCRRIYAELYRKYPIEIRDVGAENFIASLRAWTKRGRALQTIFED